MGAPQYEQAGADVAGSGTPDTIPRWATGTTLTNSIVTQTAQGVVVTGFTNGLLPTSGSTPTNASFLVRGPLTNALFMGASSASPFGTWLQSTDTAVLGNWYPLLLNPNGGNVGIGTASPAVKFHVNDGTNKNLRAYGPASGFQLLSATDAGGEAPFTLQGSTVTFTTAGVGRATINNVGQLLVGTTTAPVATGARGVFTTNTAATECGVQINSGVNSGGAIINSVAGGGLNFFTYTGAIGSEVYVSRATLGPTVLDISVTAGYGLKLPATPGNADTQTLDAYNEINVTVTMTCSTSGSITLGSNTIRVTRIGRKVFGAGRLTVSSISSPLGRLSFALTGCPAPFANALVQVRTANTTGLVAGEQLVGNTDTASPPNVFIDRYDANGQFTDAAQNIGATTTFLISFVYSV